MKRSLLTGIPLVLVLVLCAGAGWAWLRPRPAASWRFAPVDLGEVSRQVTATGTVAALAKVTVGTQVSGVVTALYADNNSLVKRGQVVARIDPATWETEVANALGALRKAESVHAQARADLERYRALAAQQLVSRSDLDAKVMAFESAAGDLEASRAALRKARINLGYCTITAPVDGVVTYRAVDVGQTVAASYSTPSLFTIAKDLARMKVEAAIDESDIGQVQVDQDATFTVDSYPDLTFRGKVTEVQLNATTSNNVVTYTVVLEVANVPRPDAAPARAGRRLPPTARYLRPGSSVYQGELALFPGMTANVSILTAVRRGVARVSNMALRFTPDGVSGPPGDRVWVLDHGAPRALPVRVGVAGALYSEISGPGIHPGLRVITGQDGAQEAVPAARTTSPLGQAGPPGPPPH